MNGSNVPPGLYWIHWASGGTSLASVGMKEDGQRWYAPTNWISVPSFDWSKVDKVEPLSSAPRDEETPISFYTDIPQPPFREDQVREAAVYLLATGKQPEWISSSKEQQQTPPPSFIADVIAVFRKHGKMLASEDLYCGLKVLPIKEETIKQLETLETNT